jgi:ERCC4-type nuclease
MIMTNKKMTNAMVLEVAIEVLKATDTEKYTEVVEKLDKMLVQVNKKSSANRKPTATQVENEELKEKILAHLATVEKQTVSEMMKTIPELADLTNQRVTSLVTALYKDGKVDRIVEKRKAYFTLIEK